MEIQMTQANEAMWRVITRAYNEKMKADGKKWTPEELLSVTFTTNDTYDNMKKTARNYLFVESA